MLIIADFEKMRADATKQYQELSEKAQGIIKVIEDPEAVAKLRSGVDREKNLELLNSEYKVSLIAHSGRVRPNSTQT